MDMAFGGGGLFNASWTNGSVSNIIWNDPDMGPIPVDELKLNLSRQGFGGFIFFGFGRYAELNLGFMYKNPKKIKATATVGGYTESAEEDVSNYIEGTLAMQFGIYFKYPFVMSDRLVLFPTGGIDYELSLADTVDGWWDDLWIRGGVGLDVFFNQNSFVRIHALYGFGIVVGGDEMIWSDFDSYYSHGMLVKVGVGFMF